MEFPLQRINHEIDINFNFIYIKYKNYLINNPIL